MINLNDAIDTIKEHFPRAQPKVAYMYKKKYYLIVAPSGEGDISDPFYIVDVADGKYRYLNPVEDIEAFNKSMEDGPIKSFVG